MVRAVKEAVRRLFTDIAQSQSAMRRVLNPAVEGAGSRVYPARNNKNDEKYGIRIDKGEAVHGKPNVVRLKLQLNSNAARKTIRDLASKDPHKVIANVDVDNTQQLTRENLTKVEEDLVNQI